MEDCLFGYPDYFMGCGRQTSSYFAMASKHVPWFGLLAVSLLFQLLSIFEPLTRDNVAGINEEFSVLLLMRLCLRGMTV